MDLIRRIADLENKVAHLEAKVQMRQELKLQERVNTLEAARHPHGKISWDDNESLRSWKPDAKAYLEMTAYAAGAAFIPDDGQDVSHICPRDAEDDMA